MVARIMIGLGCGALAAALFLLIIQAVR